MSSRDGLNRVGTIITFYSYKGGTGRSMALANVGWILAAAGKRVLMIDWDLEAPGLHRYFRPFLIDPDLIASDGLIDLVLQYATEAVKPADERGEAWVERLSDVAKYTQSIDYDFPGGGLLDLIPAGRQRDTYAVRVSTFNWQNFYERLGGEAYIESLRTTLRQDYDYVLIDSRTGVSDTAGICTVQFPDLLAVCFTYNNQSSEGTAGVAASVHYQRVVERHDSGFRIVPLPMRVDSYERAKLDARRAYAWTLFDPLIDWISDAERRVYWTKVEVPYIPVFAYEEVLATFRDEPSDPKSVLYALVSLTGFLTSGSVTSFRNLSEPEERERILAAFAETTSEKAVTSSTAPESAGEAAIRRAERVYGSLTAEEREVARRFWLRLVRITGDEEAGFLVRVRVPESDLSDIDPDVVNVFVGGGVVNVTTENGVMRYEAAHDALGADWPRLRDWAIKCKDFLQWRQRIRPRIDDWVSESKRSERLMPRWLLDSSRPYLSEDLTPLELEYLAASQRAVRKGKLITWAATIAGVLSIAFGLVELQRREKQRVAAANRDAVRRIVDAAVSSTDSLESTLLLAELGSFADPQSPELMKGIRQVAARVAPRTLIRAGSSPIEALAFSPSGRRIVTGAADGTLTVWDAMNGQSIAVLQGGSRTVDKWAATSNTKSFSIALPRDDVVVTDVRVGSVRRWRLTARGAEPPVDFPPASKDSMGSIVWYASASHELIDIGPDHIAFRDPSSMEVISSHQAAIGGILRISFTPDGSLAAVWGDDHPSLWDLRKISRTQKQLINGIGPVENFNDLALTRSPLRLIVASYYRIEVLSPSAHESATMDVTDTWCVDATNDLLGSGDANGIGRLWHFSDPNHATPLLGHHGGIHVVAFTPEGVSPVWFATGSSDGTVQIWPVSGSVPPSDWSKVPDYFRKRTTACLTAEQRSKLLGENTTDATKKYRQCEQQFGRSLSGSSAF